MAMFDSHLIAHLFTFLTHMDNNHKGQIRWLLVSMRNDFEGSLAAMYTVCHI